MTTVMRTADMSVEPTPRYLEGVNWMYRGNLTLPILWDSLDRIANLTGYTRIDTEKRFWKCLAHLEDLYGLKVYLTGQVFSEGLVPDEELDRDFWETFVERLLELTQETAGLI